MKLPSVLTVTQINTYLKMKLEEDESLNNIYLSGELSNFIHHGSSGHFYFSLKDDNSTIRAVMFSRSAARVRFHPENGMAVLVRGKISIYEREGQYQLYAEDMQPSGVGALHLAFTQLKDKLEREGLFDAKKKLPIPKFPKRIGIITAKDSAALQDMLQIFSRRYPIAEVVVVPVMVQGEEAASQLTAAIQAMNQEKNVDVILIGRGGGNAEDLWAFNDEQLARKIAASAIPVISAVGHETDYTLCDFASDLRAPTPSAAAELATPDQEELEQCRTRLTAQLSSAFFRRIQQEKNKLKMISLSISSPQYQIIQAKTQLETLQKEIQYYMKSRLYAEQGKLGLLFGKIEAYHPFAVLKRGYAIVYKEKQVISDVAELQTDDVLTLQLETGTIECVVTQSKFEKRNEKS